MRFIFILFFVPLWVFPQQPVTGVVVDNKTKQPLEFVDVFTQNDHTSTNADGRYELNASPNDTIGFNLIGYEKHSSISLPDTVFLNSKFYELDEVIVSNEKTSLGKFIKVGANYPFEPYTETFFLRASLKKNDSIIKIVDVNGFVHRKQLLATAKKPIPKNNIEVQITNMRKAGKKEKEVYFVIYGFEKLNKILTSIAMSSEYYDFEENTSQDSTKNKLTFKAKPNHGNISSRGHYIINSSDMAIEEFYLIEDSDTVPFKEKKGVKYRTIFYEINVQFKADEQKKPYYLSKAKINATVELYLDNEIAPIIYDAQYLWFGLNRVNVDISKNVSSKKDVFKLDFPFNKVFWEKPSPLLLTGEMKDFINTMNTSHSRKGYISNIHK